MTAHPVFAESEYPVHKDIATTMFYVGELPSKDNGFIGNESSAWDARWVEHFGCIDDPRQRVGFWPAACLSQGKTGPLQNPFYFALPFGEYDENGVLEQVQEIPWYNQDNGDQVYAQGGSLLKNHWMRIDFNGKTVYAQWEDTGPRNWDDSSYVWGQARPTFARSGLDVSPAVNAYLGLDGLGRTTWQFVDADEVPDGPWTDVVTTSDPDWS